MVDSQSRERGAYEGDVLINALSGYSFEDDYTLARFSNEYLATHRTWPVEYVYYTIINAWNDYLYTGNSDSLENYYNILCGNGYNRSLYWNLFQPEYGLLKIPTSGQNTTNAVLVDWPNTETDGYVRKDYNTVMNAVACGAFTDLANIAGVLGKTEDQAQWKGHADTLKAGLLEHLYDEGREPSATVWERTTVPSMPQRSHWLMGFTGTRKWRNGWRTISGAREKSEPAYMVPGSFWRDCTMRAPGMWPWT